MSAIIIFYSRADENYFGGDFRYVEVGNTEKAANIIAKATGADMFKLEQTVPYSKEYKACVAEARKDFMENARPELKALPNIDGYDDIYLGYPNYCGTMPMAVYTFLDSFDFTGKTIHPFCTNEGSGLAKSEQEIADNAKGATVVAGLSIHGSHVDEAQDIIADWA